MDEKLYRALVARKYELQNQVFTHPPLTMEQFNERRGRWLEVHEICEKMIEDAKGKEKE